MDSHDVTITIKTGSINGMETDENIETFTHAVLELSDQILNRSTLEIDVTKHRHIRG